MVRYRHTHTQHTHTMRTTIKPQTGIGNRLILYGRQFYDDDGDICLIYGHWDTSITIR